MTLEPFFRLAMPAAATSTDVKRGPSGGITLTCDGATPDPAVTVEPPGGVVAAVSGTDIVLTVAANAARGRRRIVARDAADPTHTARRTIRIV